VTWHAGCKRARRRGVWSVHAAPARLERGLGSAAASVRVDTGPRAVPGYLPRAPREVQSTTRPRAGEACVQTVRSVQGLCTLHLHDSSSADMLRRYSHRPRDTFARVWEYAAMYTCAAEWRGERYQSGALSAERGAWV
jgi:hypothetical protein